MLHPDVEKNAGQIRVRPISAKLLYIHVCAQGLWRWIVHIRKYKNVSFQNSGQKRIFVSRDQNLKNHFQKGVFQ